MKLWSSHTTLHERSRLNYAGNACDAGDLAIGPRTSVGLNKWCLSWPMGVYACSTVASVYAMFQRNHFTFWLKCGLKPNFSSAKRVSQKVVSRNTTPAPKYRSFRDLLMQISNIRQQPAGTAVPKCAGCTVHLSLIFTAILGDWWGCHIEQFISVIAAAVSLKSRHNLGLSFALRPSSIPVLYFNKLFLKVLNISGAGAVLSKSEVTQCRNTLLKILVTPSP